MAVYKMVYRDGDNPNTSSLHCIEKYCNASNRTEAAKIFDDTVGVKWVVAGPILMEETKVPKDAVFIN